MKIVSNKHIIPQLNRINTKESKIQIIVSAQNKIINTLTTYKQQPTIKPLAAIPPPISQPNKIISTKRLPTRPANPNKPKQPTIIYKTDEPPPDYKTNIYKLMNIGQDKILIVIANGPSINETELGLLKNRPKIDTLSINKPDHRIWPTTYWSFYDTSQLKRHEALFNDYEGILLNSASIKRHKQTSTIFKNIGGMKFSRDLTTGLCIGRTSCYAAIQLALWMNYKKIYFFGVDMDPDGINGQLHFYGINPDVAPDARKTRFKFEAEYFDFAADNMSYQERQRFVFCSSYLKWPFKARFGHIDHCTAVSEILKLEATL